MEEEWFSRIQFLLWTSEHESVLRCRHRANGVRRALCDKRNSIKVKSGLDKVGIDNTGRFVL